MLTDEELAHYHSEGYVVRRGAFDCQALVERLAPVVDERPLGTVPDVFQHFHAVLLAHSEYETDQLEPLLALAEWLVGTVVAGGRRVCGNEVLRHSMLSLLGAAPESSYRQHWHKVCFTFAVTLALPHSW